VTTSVWPRTAAFDGQRLVSVGGLPVTALAADHGTPLYVLDGDELVGRMREYRAAFGPDVTVAYAAKALCVVGVLQVAATEGLHVDVASAGELHTAVRAGYDMDRVLFHGNNKSASELNEAVELGVGRVVVDSFSELERLSVIATERGAQVPVLLRVTPGVEAHTHEYIRTGHDDSKFGFTLSAGLAHRAVSAGMAAPGLRLRGLHCHIGSQVHATEAFSAAVALMVRLLADVRAEHGVELDELNVGGGLGIGYTTDEHAPTIAEYAEALTTTVRQEAARAGLDNLRLTVEPGRSIVGPSGITLYTVGTVKDIPGVRRYASVDGGMSDNPRPALYDAAYTFAQAGERSASAHLVPTSVAGKHCESGDVLATDVLLPDDLSDGDLLAVAATGAYNHAMASNYNRLPRPAMVLVANGRADLLVRRETLDDVVARDVPLPDRPIDSGT
jgi:diaminopimelate decarboxylase